MKRMRTVAIITAGGRGRRMGRRKQFLRIAGRPMLEWTLSAFQRSAAIDGMILVVAKEEMAKARQLRFSKILQVVAGGEMRQDSVENGIKALPVSAQWVVVHDGARPAVTPVMIAHSLKAARVYGAAVVGVPVKDTLKVVSSESLVVSRTLDRSQLWAAQTPQAFRAKLIKDAYRRLKGKFTDDAMLIEKTGLRVKMVLGSPENIKVTIPEDRQIMEGILLRRK